MDAFGGGVNLHEWSAPRWWWRKRRLLLIDFHRLAPRAVQSIDYVCSSSIDLSGSRLPS